MNVNQQEQKPKSNVDVDEIQIICDPPSNAVKIVADSVTEQLKQLNTNSKWLLIPVMIFAVMVLITGLILLGFGLYGVIYDPDLALLKLFLAIVNPVIIGYQLSMLVSTYAGFCDHFCCAHRARRDGDRTCTQDKIDCQTLITWLVFCTGTIIMMIMQLYIYSFEFDAVLLMVAFVLETMLKVLENEQQISQQNNLQRWKDQLNDYYELILESQRLSLQLIPKPKVKRLQHKSNINRVCQHRHIDLESQDQLPHVQHKHKHKQNRARKLRARKRNTKQEQAGKNTMPTVIELPLSRSISDPWPCPQMMNPKQKFLKNVFEKRKDPDVIQSPLNQNDALLKSDGVNKHLSNKNQE